MSTHTRTASSILCCIFLATLSACGNQYNRSDLDPSGWYAVDTVFVSTETNSGGPQRTIRHHKSYQTLDPRWYSPPYETNDYAAVYAPYRNWSFYQMALWASCENEKKAARNNLQNAMIGVSDDIFDDHMSSVFATQDGANLLLGWTAIGFTATGAAGASAELMSALATAVLGAKASLNEEVYAKQIAETISRTITEDRQRYKQLLRVWQMRSSTSYPIEAAIADAKEYHRRGSFFHGLELILESAQDKARDDKKAAEKLSVIAAEEDDDTRNAQLRELFSDASEDGLTANQRILYLLLSAAPDEEAKEKAWQQLLKTLPTPDTGNPDPGAGG